MADQVRENRKSHGRRSTDQSEPESTWVLGRFWKWLTGGSRKSTTNQSHKKRTSEEKADGIPTTDEIPEELSQVSDEGSEGDLDENSSSSAVDADEVPQTQRPANLSHPSLMDWILGGNKSQTAINATGQEPHDTESFRDKVSQFARMALPEALFKPKGAGSAGSVPEIVETIHKRPSRKKTSRKGPHQVEIQWKRIHFNC